MEIEIKQERLSRALSAVSRIATLSRSGLQILNNVLIRADNNQLSLIATNLELAITNNIPAKTKTAGTITVPARLVAEFVANLPKSTDIKLLTKDNKLTITAGTYKSTINGIAADDFPELPGIDEKKATKITTPATDLHAAITQVAISSSNDTSRPTLTGAYFNTFEDNLYIATTDGYRLSEKKLQKIPANTTIAAIVPTNSLQEVLRSLSDDIDEVELLFDETQVRFRLGDTEITSKLIDGSFPDYRQLIPQKTTINAQLDRAEFTRMAKVAALFARESGGSIVCETRAADKLFSIGAVANELGENSSDIHTEVAADGKVVINSRFLLDTLSILQGDTLNFGFSSKLAPVVIRSTDTPDYTHIIMPLKS